MPMTSTRSPVAFTFNVNPTISSRSDSFNTGLMQDMPRTPTRELAAMQAATPTSAISPSNNNLTSPSSSFIARSRARWTAFHLEVVGFLSAYTRPWLTNRYTLLILSFMIITFNLVSLYFTGFSLYLTHFLHTVHVDPATGAEYEGQCSSVTLSTFLIFVFFRCLFELSLVGVRFFDNTLWVNAWTQLRIKQKVFISIRTLLYVWSVIFVSLGVAWLATVDRSQCVALGYEVVAGLVAFEALSLATPFAFVLPLSLFFHWRSVSIFAPFLPMTQESFKAKAKGMTQREINQLPSAIYSPSRHVRDDKCSVCLAEFNSGESIRVLTCQHTFHAACIDGWLTTKNKCPLCVRTVEIASNRRFSFHFSRTRRADSVSQPQNENELSQTRNNSQNRDLEFPVNDTHHQSVNHLGIEIM